MTGRVLSLHRWPVKSMGGEEVDALRVDHRGAGGDRTHVVLDEHKGRVRQLTARQAPRLLAWHATYPRRGADLDPAAPPLPALRSPAGTRWAWDDPRLRTALEDDLGWGGRGLRLHRDVAGRPDIPGTLLVTVEATRADAERSLGRPLDIRRFRPNLHVQLDAEPWTEHGWEGRVLHVGDAVLELLHPCVRCVMPTRDPDTQERWPGLLRWLHAERDTLFGMNARVTAPATISVGDAVSLR